MTHEHRPIVKKHEALILLISILVLGFLSYGAHAARPLGSVEVKFADRSTHGLAIIPASCPSDPHYPGECSGGGYAQGSYGGGGYAQGSYTSNPSCTPSASCLNGSTLQTISASCVVQTTACPTDWSCAAGACIPPAGPSVVSFAARLPTGQSFTSSGHLEAHPTLVRAGNSTNLYWNVTNVASCTVSSPNGDNFTCSGKTCSSGANGQVTKPLPQQTTYTLACTALSGATPSSLGETVKVTVVPTYQEQ